MTLQSSTPIRTTQPTNSGDLGDPCAAGASRKSIDQVFGQLYAIDNDDRWAVADSALLQSIADDTSQERGRNGKRLYRLLRIASTMRLQWLLVGIVGLMELTNLYRRHRKSDRRDVARDQFPQHWFVGFGAGPEERMFSEYSIDRQNVARICQTDVAQMGSWTRVRYRLAYHEFVSAFKSARRAIKALPSELVPFKLDFYVFITIRIAYFAFQRAWFRAVKDVAPNTKEACFLAADTTAFAAISAGLPTRYIQHGLIRHSLIFPSFDHVDAITIDEAKHIQARIPNADVTHDTPVTAQRGRTPGVILIASIYADEQRMRQIEPFLHFAVQHGWELFVRPHPRQDLDTWQNVGGTDSVKVENSDASVEAAIERLKPMIVVSWHSTAMANTLNAGVIPVTVCARDDREVYDLVYPLMNRCLHWPTEKESILLACESDQAYTRIRDDLRVRAD